MVNKYKKLPSYMLYYMDVKLDLSHKGKNMDWGCLRTGQKVKVKLSLCFNWVPSHEGVLGSGGI